MTNTADVFEAHASEYDAARRRLIPPYDAFYAAAVEAVGLVEAPRRILDLGAGTGLLSGFVRAAFPDVELTLVDGSPAMLDLARARLGDAGGEYRVADLAEPLPDGPWDAVVSALAIHHLDDAGKRALFARAFAALKPGGMLVDAEQVAGPGPLFVARYAAWHEERARAAGCDDAEWDAAVARMAHDRCATVEDQLSWMLDAGFVAADCLLKDHNFAVLAARRCARGSVGPAAA